MLDDQLDALSNVHRRRLLRDLIRHNPQHDRPATFDDPDLIDESKKQLIAMRHVHLPKLEDYRFVSWDREAGRVTKGPQFDEIKPLLTVLKEHEDKLLVEEVKR